MTSAAAFAQDASNSLSERATMSSARQARIRAETEKATADLSRIIDEFDRNGLGDEQDAKMLRAVRDTLTKLTDSQMEQVLALLDQARNAHSDDAAKTHSASAFAEQQQIYAAMQKTLLAFQQQADLLELSLQFSALAKRENANFKATKHLALRSMNARDLDEGKTAELHVQQTEQDSISTEVSARLDKLASLMKAVDPAVAQQLSMVTQQVAPAALKQALSASSSELRLAHLTKSASEELSSYKQLREFSRLAKPPREPEQILTDAADQMAITIAGYQVTINDTIAAHRGENDENRMSVDDEQGDLVDDVSDVSKDVEKLAPAAFSTLGIAKDMMQDARSAGLGGSDRQQRTLPVLVQARQEILDELKRRQLMAQMQDGSNKLERAQAVRDEVKQLADQQKQIIEETHKAHSDEAVAAVAAKQSAVTDALKALSPAAAKELPQVAQAVDNAAATSSQANDRLAENKPHEALDPQKQTLDALTNAEKQADATAADLEKKADELQQLQQTHDDIARIANGEQALAVQTAVAAAQNPQQANAQTSAASPEAKTSPAAKTPAPDAQQPPARNSPQANAQTPPPANTPESAASNAPQANAQTPAADAAAKARPADAAKADTQKSPAPNADAAASPAARNPAAPDAAKADAADPLKTEAPTAKQLANSQQALAQQTQKLQAAAPPGAGDAAQPLKDAAQEMIAAGKQLDQNAPAPAQQPEQGAIDALKKAQAAVDQKMDQLKQELGEKPDQNAELNAAGQEVQQALQNTNEAQAAMRENKGNQAGEKMEAAAQHAASAEDKGALPPAAEADLAQAHQELGKGAAAEAGGNEKAAGQHAAAAAGLLQQAMQQIQQAQGNQPGNEHGKDAKGGKKADQWKPGQMGGGEPPKGVHPARVDANGNRDQVAGSSSYNGLPDRDRAAVTESGSEPAPAQYESRVQQYMRNLADDSETPGEEIERRQKRGGGFSRHLVRTNLNRRHPKPPPR